MSVNVCGLTPVSSSHQLKVCDFRLINVRKKSHIARRRDGNGEKKSNKNAADNHRYYAATCVFGHDTLDRRNLKDRLVEVRSWKHTPSSTFSARTLS